MTRAGLHAAARRTQRLASIALVAAAPACGGSGNNQACTDDLDCQSSFVCIADPGLAEARCMRACGEGARLCDDGSVCFAFAGGRACHPGGPVGFGEPCTASLECEAGTVCPTSLGACAQACDGTARVCLATEHCRTDDPAGPYCGP